MRSSRLGGGLAATLRPLRRDGLRPTTWLDAAAAVCALTLVMVHVVQWMGWPPCELCLHQREVYWTALAVALCARVAGLRYDLAPRIGCVALGVAFGAGAVLAAYHAGVEWRWWAGPAACTGGGRTRLTAASVGALFDKGSTVHVVRCDAAAFRVAGLSMAGWNVLLSLALCAVSLAVPLRSRSRT